MRRAVVVVGVLGLVIVAVALVWADAFGRRESPRRAAREEAREEPASENDEPWIIGDDDPGGPDREEGPRREGRWPGRGARGDRAEGRRWDPNSPEFAERRARWQEHWRQSVDIAALGPNAPSFDADAVREALSPGREALRECIGQNGGWRAMRDASRNMMDADAGRPGRHASFDVRSDGTVDPSSLTIEPAMPAQFAQCFETFFTSATFDNAGDGARVELPMGPPGGGRGGRGMRRESGR